MYKEARHDRTESDESAQNTSLVVLEMFENIYSSLCIPQSCANYQSQGGGIYSFLKEDIIKALPPQKILTTSAEIEFRPTGISHAYHSTTSAVKRPIARLIPTNDHAHPSTLQITTNLVSFQQHKIPPPGGPLI